MKEPISVPSEVEELPPPRRLAAFEPLAHRDFRLLWSGLLLSNLGSWMQITGMGYLVATLAPHPNLAPLYLGLVGLSRAIPVIALSPIAGLVADRLPRRRVLLVTNTAMLLLSGILAAVTYAHRANLLSILAISGGLAGALSFDSPARQSWVPILVPRRMVASAIGLNSVAFNLPSVLGPALAGPLIAGVGVAGCFAANAVSYLAVVVAVVFMRHAPPSSASKESAFESIRDGLRFLLSHPALRWVVFYLTASAVLARPFFQLLPSYALHQLGTGVIGYTWVVTANGLGGFLGALLAAFLGGVRRRGAIWAWTGIGVGAGVAALGFTYHLYAAVVELIAIGALTLVFVNSSNVLIQTLSPDAMRGRAISVYSMVLLGILPAGALGLGALGSLIGIGWTFVASGLATVAIGVWTWFAKPQVRQI
ncbi:MAG TPA: MFS transporter [Candidatus Dormibacteraeota bacterium]|nr:MFS transporter [Candidatus Dormibacteraeota bacterium]